MTQIIRTWIEFRSCIAQAMTWVLWFGIATVPVSVAAQTFTTLYQFQFGPDGATPYSGLIRDAQGNLYGTTTAGGSSKSCLDGCGTVFKLDTAGKETVLHGFKGTDGANPYAGVIRDSKGNLYGTTLHGGSHGAGTVFRLGSNGKIAILHSFTAGADGGFPYAGLVRDRSGNLYGTTYLGGKCAAYYGCGTVFQLDSAGQETVLYSFQGGDNDGAFPYAGLVRDSKGNLYGTTLGGGDYHCEPNGCGTVFEVHPNHTEAVLWSFSVTDAFVPYAGLARDAAGNLYGATAGGGPTYGGTLFKLDPNGQKTTLYAFTQESDGGFPEGTPVRDKAGNLYGTTLQLGADYVGTAFRLDPAGNFSVLHAFTGEQDGAMPVAGLILDSTGKLYGTTSAGGNDLNGTVFEITP